MKKLTRTQQDRAVKKVEIAIDKMIDLKQDFPLKMEHKIEIGRILDSLNHLSHRIYRS